MISTAMGVIARVCAVGDLFIGRLNGCSAHSISRDFNTGERALLVFRMQSPATQCRHDFEANREPGTNVVNGEDNELE